MVAILMKHVHIRDINRRIEPHQPHLDEITQIFDMHTPDSDFEPGSTSRALRLPIEIDCSNWTRHLFHDTTRHVWTWYPNADPIGVLVVHDRHN